MNILVVPDFSRNVLSLSPFIMMLAIGLLYVVFILLKYVPFILSLFKAFIMEYFVKSLFCIC